MNQLKHNMTSSHDFAIPHCLVLGAGGARGLAHLGVIRALGERNVQINRIVGVSMGSLIGGLCAVEGNVANATQRVLDFFNSSSGRKLRSAVFATGGASNPGESFRWPVAMFRELKKGTAMLRAVRSQSLLSSTVLRNAIDSVVPDLCIEDLSTPIQIATVDIRTGKRVILNSGSLRKAIRASMSIPGIFPAVHYQSQRLGDVGVYDSVPCDIPVDPRCMLQEMEPIIAVDVGQDVEEQTERQSALRSALRFQAFAEQTIRQQSLARADLIVKPSIEQTPWFDFSNPEKIIQAGYEAALITLGSLEQSVATTPRTAGNGIATVARSRNSEAGKQSSLRV